MMMSFEWLGMTHIHDVVGQYEERIFDVYFLSFNE
jgi:hypothetical protein